MKERGGSGERLTTEGRSGTAHALYWGIVKSVRFPISALTLVVVLVAASIVPVYGVQARPECRPIAAQAAHDCCKAPILNACCAARSDGSQQSGPAQSKVQLDPSFTAAPAILIADLISRTRSVGTIASAPPRVVPLDLPILLSTLLL
jgi:hypothetical protein